MKCFLLSVVMVATTFPGDGGMAAQDTAASSSAHMETRTELLAKLTPEQKQQFDTARKAFDAHRPAEALMAFKALLHDLPGDAILSKFASEAALQTEDAGFAVAALLSVVQADPADWQALALLTRAYAETGDKVHGTRGWRR